MVMEDDLTLGGGHIMYHTDHVLYKGTLEACVILIISAIPINFIKKTELRYCFIFYMSVYAVY